MVTRFKLPILLQVIRESPNKKKSPPRRVVAAVARNVSIR
jgi:hypothetical protein